MTRKTLTAFAVIAIGMTMLLLASCSFLMPKEVSLVNNTPAAVIVNSQAFIGEQSVTVPANGSTTVYVSSDTTSILVNEEGMYYQMVVETLKVTTNGKATLTPNASWICIVNDTDDTLTYASYSTYKFDCDSSGTKTVTSIEPNQEKWLLVSSGISSGDISFAVTGNSSPYKTGISFSAPEIGKFMKLAIKGPSTVVKLLG